MNRFDKELPKKYKNDADYSYALGPYPTFELLNQMPQNARAVFLRDDFNESQKLQALCKLHNVPCYTSNKALDRISNKELCFAAGIFEKFQSDLEPDLPHIVLVNPSDMGNLGTIIRTILGFGIKNLAIIEPGADIFHPKVIRASMGAIFQVQISKYSSFPDYLESFRSPHRKIYLFMLQGGQTLQPTEHSSPYSLVFGNEASGLPSHFRSYGNCVFIPQTSDVDSLNLAVAVAIGTYVFTSY